MYLYLSNLLIVQQASTLKFFVSFSYLTYHFPIELEKYQECSPVGSSTNSVLTSVVGSRCASAGANVGAETAAALRARAALTLASRYYPEGGWGWTVTVVGTLVQVITHGLQLGGGTGAIACTAAVRFKVAPLYTHGEYKLQPTFRT